MAIKTQVESPAPIWKASEIWAACNPSTGDRDWETLKICWPASLEKWWASGQWSSNWPPMHTYTDIRATHSRHTHINKFYKILKVAEDSTLKKKSPRVSHVAMRLQEEQRMLSHTSLWKNVSFLDNHHQGQWHGFPFLGVYSTVDNWLTNHTP